VLSDAVESCSLQQYLNKKYDWNPLRCFDNSKPAETQYNSMDQAGNILENCWMYWSWWDLASYEYVRRWIQSVSFMPPAALGKPVSLLTSSLNSRDA
jgi:hypothetical protein